MALIEERQVTAARVITQTLTRASTTITTLVTLGTGVLDDFPTPTLEPPPPPPPPAAPAQATSSGSVLTNEQLGAILGSVLGFLVIVVPLIYSLIQVAGAAATAVAVIRGPEEGDLRQCASHFNPSWYRRRHGYLLDDTRPIARRPSLKFGV
ncbi:hypothetical protein QBC34DRAFT_378679 [Podospora aff. communis PSN243]|uniref:Uncharacterized protein n=1 Tax=Podospora aff. communis PSN243 TaxID=3040156 RepID=A0AAV9GTX6_9PEZI|nr:hypothetical protein QBC34DRAFT_378679 [Podospora aff. communis PSN243]